MTNEPKFNVGDIVIHTEISDLEWLPKDHPRKAVNLCIITDVYEMVKGARQLYGVHYFKLMRNESYVKESELSHAE